MILAANIVIYLNNLQLLFGCHSDAHAHVLVCVSGVVNMIFAWINYGESTA